MSIDKKEIKELNEDELDKVTGGGATNRYDTDLLLTKLSASADDDSKKPDEQTLEEIANELFS